MGKALVIISLGFSLIFTRMMLNVSSSQQLSSREIVEQYEQMIARNAMDSATNVALSKVYRNQATADTMSFGSATFQTRLDTVTADSVNNAMKEVVTVVAQYGDISDTTTAVFVRPAYSYYFYLVHDWPDDPDWLEFTTGDTIPGPIHTNNHGGGQQILINDEPVFIGKVSSVETNFQGSGSPNPKFYGGAEFGANEIPLADASIAAPLLNVASLGGDVFTTDVEIEFLADGTYNHTGGGQIDGNKAMNALNGTIAVIGGNARIWGEVNGQMTIYATGDIEIEDSVIYHSDPRNDPGSDDFLGLVAMQDIEVLDRPSTDIQIHAAMFAVDEFMVVNYDTAPDRGTLSILGSIATHRDRPSGTISTGFARAHYYDIRLRDQTPPYFPRLNNRRELLYRKN